MTKKIPMKIPIEKVILILAASFAAYNFGLAGGYIEGTKFSFGGLAAGIVVNVSLAIAASQYGGLRGDKRVRQALIAFILMLVLSPVLISPVIYYSLPDTFLGVWWLRAIWSVGWPLVADLAIVLAGAVSGKGLISLAESAKPAEQVRRPARSSAKATTQTASSASQSSQSTKPATQSPQPAKVYECTWPGCDWSTEQSVAVARGGDPQAALAAHISHHNRKAEKFMAEKTRMQS